MSLVHSSRRWRWLVVASIAGLVTVVTIAVGIADPTVPTEIKLVLGSGANQFEYGSQQQLIAPGRNECTVNPDTNGAGLVTVTHSTFNKQGNPVTGKLGLVEDGLGVNEKGNGNGQDCGRIDYLGSGRSESLTLAVGPTVIAQEQVFAWIDFDLEAKYDAEVRFEFFSGSEKVGTQRTILNTGSDSGPDSKFRDKYRVHAYPGAPNGQPTMTEPSEIVPFDTVVITMVTGAVSIEGGATWNEAPGDSAANHRTVFHLATARTAISIDTVVSGYASDDLGFVPAGTTLSWSHAVTNTGDLPLTNVSVVDDQGLTITGPTGDDGDGILSPGETWDYSSTNEVQPSTAGGPGETHIVTASAESDIRSTSASDTVTYFGMNASLELNKTTSGSDGESIYSGPGDDILIVSGDTVKWTYTVTNTGNVTLSGVGVEDDTEGSATCSATTVAPGNSVECTISGVAETSEGEAASDGTYFDGYANSATASATHAPTETDATATDASGYFGTNAVLYVEVSNNGIGTPPVVSGDEVLWTVFVRNDGNVEIEVIIAQEDLPPGTTPNQCEIVGSLAPGDSDTCEISTPTVAGEQTTSFTVTGQDPLGMVVEQSSGTVGYFGGLDCGESTNTGGPDVDDTPLAGFFVGPLTKGTECAVPVEIVSTNNPGDPDQSVFVGPPSGYSWAGVTGLLTVEWDIEDPADSGVRPTFQVVGLTVEEVPMCAGDVAVEIVAPGPGEFLYTMVDNPTGDGSYPNAVGVGGDICLVLHTTRTINYDNDGTPEVKTVTTEVFYIYNDPSLSRPR